MWVIKFLFHGSIEQIGYYPELRINCVCVCTQTIILVDFCLILMAAL